MSRQLQAEIEVQGSPERVREVLADFAAYHEWNPFIVQATGTPQPGQRLELKMRPAGRRATRFRPEVLEADPGRRLRWLGRTWYLACSTASTASPSSPTARAGSA
jgi:hypothetical protein